MNRNFAIIIAVALALALALALAVALAVALALVLAACTQPIPNGLNTATTRTTDQGQFRLSYKSELDPVAINEIHSGVLHVETTDGRPVTDATVLVDGGIPQHGHGLRPRSQTTWATVTIGLKA